MNQIQIIGSIMAATGLKIEDAAKDVFQTSKYTIYRAIRGESTPAMRAKIAEVINKHESEIWPEQQQRSKHAE